MTVSLVTVVRNCRQYLPATLDSVRRLEGERPEYVVIDGGSTDGTLEVLEQSRDLITHLESGADKGMYDALRKGFSKCGGDIFGWINADDLLMPWCFSIVRRYFEAFPECEWLTGVPTMFDARGDMVWSAAVAPRYRRAWISRGWYSARGLGAIQQESTFFRRTLYEKVGGIDAAYRLAGDFDLWRRFARHADLHQVGTVLAGFRQHEANLSRNLKRYLDEAAAPRIPGGTFLGSLYSYGAFCLSRLRGEQRFKDVAFGSNERA